MATAQRSPIRPCRANGPLEGLLFATPAPVVSINTMPKCIINTRHANKSRYATNDPQNVKSFFFLYWVGALIDTARFLNLHSFQLLFPSWSHHCLFSSSPLKAHTSRSTQMSPSRWLTLTYGRLDVPRFPAVLRSNGIAKHVAPFCSIRA